MVKLQFSTQHCLLSEFIRVVTFSEYSHVDVLIPLERRAPFDARMWDGGQNWSHAGDPAYNLLGALDPGVVLHPAYNYSKAEVCDVGGMTAEQEDRFYAFLSNQVGKPYDWSAVTGFLLRRDWAEHEKWFCSELVAAAFQAAGYPIVRAVKWRVAPQDLLQSPLIANDTFRTLKGELN